MAKTDSQYQGALDCYWNGAFGQCADLIAKTIQSTEQQYAPRFYRLWIECLAASSDLGAIRELRAHIGRISTGNSSDWLALQGLACLDLDEPDLARLFLSFTSVKSSVYATELLEKLSFRTGEKFGSTGEATIDLLAKGRDYICWHEIAGLKLLASGKTPTQLLKRISNSTWRTQLSEEFELRKNIEGQEYENALTLCRKRLGTYPNHEGWRKLTAYLSTEQRQYQDAIEVAGENNSAIDPELSALLGLCHWQLAPQLASSNAETALKYYEEALNSMKSNNWGTIDLELARDFLRSEVPVQKHDNSNLQHWLVPLQARHAYNIQNGPESEIDFLVRSADPAMKSGDILYLGSFDTKSFKVSGVYRVATAPVADPFLGLAVQSSLIRQFPRRVDVGGLKKSTSTVQLSREQGIKVLEQLDEFCRERAQTQVSLELKLAKTA